MPRVFDYTIYKTDGSIAALAPIEELDDAKIEEMLGGEFEVNTDLTVHDYEVLAPGSVVYSLVDQEAADLNPHWYSLTGDVLVRKLHRFSEEMTDGN